MDEIVQEEEDDENRDITMDMDQDEEPPNMNDDESEASLKDPIKIDFLKDVDLRVSNTKSDMLVIDDDSDLTL